MRSTIELLRLPVRALRGASRAAVRILSLCLAVSLIGLGNTRAAELALPPISASADNAAHGPDLYPPLAGLATKAAADSAVEKAAEPVIAPVLPEPKPSSAGHATKETDTEPRCPLGGCPAAGCTKGCRDGDQIWLVSTRGVGCGNVGIGPAGLRYYRYQRGAWIASSFDEYNAAADPLMPTTFWVHGNRIQSDEAKSSGLTVYRQVTSCAPAVPLRYVIWSWPSDPIKGLLEDARVKANRTNVDAYLLADFLNHAPPQSPICLMGYSFGARVVVGGLHLLGGGQLAGRVLAAPNADRADSFNVILLASAFNNDWLASGRRMGRAMSQVGHMLLLNNPNDRVLMRYFRLDPALRSDAIGYTGLRGNLGPERAKITQVNIYARSHSWTEYLFSSRILSLMRPYIFSMLGVDIVEPRTVPPLARRDGYLPVTEITVRF